jgi:hypothetical protein
MRWHLEALTAGLLMLAPGVAGAVPYTIVEVSRDLRVDTLARVHDTLGEFADEVDDPPEEMASTQVASTFGFDLTPARQAIVEAVASNFAGVFGGRVTFSATASVAGNGHPLLDTTADSYLMGVIEFMVPADDDLAAGTPMDVLVEFTDIELMPAVGTSTDSLEIFNLTKGKKVFNSAVSGYPDSVQLMGVRVGDILRLEYALRLAASFPDDNPINGRARIEGLIEASEGTAPEPGVVMLLAPVALVGLAAARRRRAGAVAASRPRFAGER